MTDRVVVAAWTACQVHVGMQLLCQGIDDAGTQAALAKAEVALGVPVPLSAIESVQPVPSIS
jgi:hypothetical protein